MEKQIIYFVRHAEAVGQEPDAVLTDGGRMMPFAYSLILTKYRLIKL